MKYIAKSKRWIIGLVLLGAVIMVGFSQKDDFKISKSLDIYYSLFRELNIFYVDDINPQKLVETSIESMLESLDPYTKYIPEKDMDDFKFMTTGDYGGIGALIRKEGDYAVISQPYKDFPADQAGLRTGDLIKAINGESIKGWELKQVSNKLKGIPDTEVAITIDRMGRDEPLEKQVVRKDLHINSVPYYGMTNPEQGTGYIRLTKFTQGCGQEVREAYQQLTGAHQVNALVLDLRSNPGGLLQEAVNVANVFIPKGQKIVSTKGRVEKWNQSYPTQKQPLDTNVRLVVLVNRASASASEIVAGAVQDLDRGVVVGRRTFGKGLVQATRPLSYNSKLKVTTAKYYIPSGRCIQAKDYSNRNDDGSVGEIPDSLVHQFTTRHGRTVFDGGGIRPDVEVEQRDLSKMEISLITKNLVFDFATQYALNNDTIPPVDEYEVSDETFNQFSEFLQGKQWDYTTESEEKLEKLIEVAKEEDYYAQAESTLNELEKKMAHDKQQDLKRYENSIKERLEQEIAGRYYYQKGQIRAGLEEDKQLEKAVEISIDTNLYQDIIQGDYPRDNIKNVKE